ncbi:hypothetical protein BGZ70_004476 [Mortierella alpina]|uniref:F-box domain-containing protein n=1 Tax=Mortierella alpina TaxID=64518 RepID=A0A9P6IQS4_MORAP|nr:hypothetical protein BGZ70_004476 [Mortierella alpina]
MTHHPLEVPELRLHIAQYLPLADHKACALVCKAWYDDFQSLVWERLSLGIPVRSTRLSSSSLDDQIQPRVREVNDLYKNAHLVRHLTAWITHDIAKEQYETLFERFGHLVTLEARASDRDGWEAFKKLIQRNDGLQQIKLNDSSRHWRNIADPDLHTALSEGNHAQLHRLDITCETTVASLLSILEACPALDELIVDRSLATRSEIEQDSDYKKQEEEEGYTSLPIPTTTTTTTSASTFPLQQFLVKANVSDPALIDLLKRCPRLWRLGFNALTDMVHQGICNLLQAGLLPNLNTVHFASQFLSCPRHSDILFSVLSQQVREVEIEDPYPDMVVALYGRQSQTLERVRLSNVPNPIGFVGFLVHCPKLKQVEVSMSGQGYADLRYLIASPWVCLDLEVLDVKSLGLSKEISFSDLGAPLPEWILELAADEKNEDAPGRPEWEQAQIVFMKRLGEMSKLRKLNIGDTESSLTWSLSTGFAYLAELSALEEFNLGARSKVDSIAELEFMKDCWPNLQKMISAELAPGERKWLDENWPELIVETKAANGSEQE